ncbi:MAG TPA: amidohydrolase family protein [Acidimicrobiales bacterium]|jgi:predicted TIM-barrel fold metal-dependent hydrolase|nr:amidohydrolase family protein [Acidimicrobiales bacterium]
MSGKATTLTYPAGGVGAPKDRRPAPLVDHGLPAGTDVFSADDHISLAEDIFYERLPEGMKDRAPRVMNVDGGWVLGVDGKSILVPEFIRVLTQYDPVPGSHSGDVEARLAALDSEGITKELAFPNSVLALFGWPDREVREACFRIYNEYMAEVQERSGDRIYGVGLINWWDAEGTRRTVNELKALGLKTFLMPLMPGKDPDGKPVDYSSTAMDGVWDAIEEAGVPISHHIGENPPATPIAFNALSIGMLQSVAPFRDTFGKYIFGGILDRHPGLRIGYFEGGINWVPSALQDAEHIAASFQHMADLKIEHEPTYYWDHHMCASFMVDPLGLALLARIGVDRVMWSTDFPHNESTYGYSDQSLACVVDAVGAEATAAIASGNVKRFLRIDA